MISEKEFVAGFSGFWVEAAPFLTPQLVAHINLSGQVLPQGRRAVVKPLVSRSNAEAHDLIAEIAYGLFAAAVKARTDVLSVANDKEMLAAINASVVTRILGLRGYWQVKRQDLSSPTDEAIELAVRLEEYFREYGSDASVLVQPSFKGCGILDSCYGDLLQGDHLYELKMVDRNLRGIDLRQVVVYCALDYSDQRFGIKSTSILNPRRGIVYSFAVEDLVAQISNKTPAELFHEILEFLYSFESLHRVY